MRKQLKVDPGVFGQYHILINIFWKTVFVLGDIELVLDYHYQFDGP